MYDPARDQVVAPAANEPPKPEERKRKRPGGTARISEAEKEAIREQLAERESKRQRTAPVPPGTIHDAVRQHYNNVPQRGREFRQTESSIKGLRNYNNWVKSVLIHKFSPSEDFVAGGGKQEGLLVLDIGCGKGGDLGKWQKAPQRVELYVGVDPAEVSIEQARGRYAELRQRSRGRLFAGHFFIKDGYGEWLGEIPLVKEVGIDGAVGPGGGGSARWGGGGFDVVAMMFCMHYAFESEAKARGMLRNVAGSLKKGGRFIGVIPNSDVLRSKVEEFHKRQAEKAKAAEPQAVEPQAADSDAKTLPPQPENAGPDTKAIGSKAADSKDSDTKKPSSEPKSPNSKEHAEEGHKSKTPKPPEHSHAPKPARIAKAPAHEPAEDGEIADDAVPEWGNSIYHVRFPGATPTDGIFRPPFGWKYSFQMEEAVEGVPEYVVPWEAFRALAEDYNLEMQYRRPLADMFAEEKDDAVLGPLSVRMGVRADAGSPLRLTADESEAVAFYHAFCFYRV